LTALVVSQGVTRIAIRGTACEEQRMPKSVEQQRADANKDLSGGTMKTPGPSAHHGQDLGERHDQDHGDADGNISNSGRPSPTEDSAPRTGPPDRADRSHARRRRTLRSLRRLRKAKPRS